MALGATELAILRKMNIFVPTDNTDPAGNGSGPGEAAGGMLQVSASAPPLTAGAVSRHIFNTGVAGWREAMLDHLKTQAASILGTVYFPTAAKPTFFNVTTDDWTQNA